MEVAPQAPFSIQAIQYLASFQRFFTWHVSACSLANNLDVAVLQLEPREELPPGYRPPLPTLDLANPAVGTQVQAFGFPFPDLEHNPATDVWFLTHSPVGCRGQITQAFPNGRDKTKQYPCFEMDLEIRGGMSGGPIFDAAGLLRGIVCSSFDFAEPESHISYGSALWPAFGMRVLPSPFLGIQAEGTLMDVMNAGRIQAVNVPTIVD